MYAFNPRAHPRIKRLSACLPTYLPAGWLVPHPSPMHNAHTCTRGVPTNMDNTACELLNHHLETESNMPKKPRLHRGRRRRRRKSKEEKNGFPSAHYIIATFVAARSMANMKGEKTAGYLLCVRSKPALGYDAYASMPCPPILTLTLTLNLPVPVSPVVNTDYNYIRTQAPALIAANYSFELASPASPPAPSFSCFSASSSCAALACISSPLSSDVPNAEGAFSSLAVASSAPPTSLVCPS